MKAIFLILLLIVNLIADSGYYTKEIIFKKITKPTLIRIKIDDELYNKMVSNDIKIYSSNNTIENHYIKSNPPNLQSHSSDDGYDIITLPLLSKDIELKYTDYIFKPNGIPADKIIPNILEKEYSRVAKIYVGNNQKEWHFILKQLLQRIEFSEIEDKEMILNSSTKLIKLRVDNAKNPLTIESLTIKTAPNHLYFIAKPNQKYNIHFTKEHTKNRNKKILELIGVNEPFIEGKLANLKKNRIEKKVPKEKTQENNDKGFVIAIVIAVVILFSIAVGLMKGKDK